METRCRNISELEASLERFTADADYWDPKMPGADRDSKAIARASAAGAGLESSTPFQHPHWGDMWGGGLRRVTRGGVGPRREDVHYHSPRYVPVGYARYESPHVNPADYTYYLMSGWRVAVPRSTPGPAVQDLLTRIYTYGPLSAGYARLGDTLVPAILSPGDRQSLAGLETREGSLSTRYPFA